jgi:hypothetical protein
VVAVADPLAPREDRRSFMHYVWHDKAKPWEQQFAVVTMPSRALAEALASEAGVELWPDAEFDSLEEAEELAGDLNQQDPPQEGSPGFDDLSEADKAWSRELWGS